MIITEEYLIKENACPESITWYETYHPNIEGRELVRYLSQYRFDWAQWLLRRLLNPENQVKFMTNTIRIRQTFGTHDVKYQEEILQFGFKLLTEEEDAKKEMPHL